MRMRIFFLCFFFLYPLFACGESEQVKKVDYAALAQKQWSAFVQKINNPEKTVKIVFFGDSITETNFHVHNKPNYVDYMRCYFSARNPRSETINAGKSGDTTVKGLERLQAAVLAHKPDLTFVMLGINDCSSWFNVSADDFRVSLKRIVTTLLESNSAVIVMTQNEMLENPYDGKVTFTHYPEYEKAALEIAREAGVHVIDNYARWKNIKETHYEKFKTYMSDWIHPNEEGHIFFYLTMRDELETLLASPPR